MTTPNSSAAQFVAERVDASRHHISRLDDVIRTDPVDPVKEGMHSAIASHCFAMAYLMQILRTVAPLTAERAATDLTELLDMGAAAGVADGDWGQLAAGNLAAWHLDEVVTGDDEIEATLAAALFPVVHPQTVSPEPGQVVSWDQRHVIYARTVAPLVAAMVAEAGVITDESSDGYHSFRELYEFRKLYNAALFTAWHREAREAGTHGFRVHKSLRHHDGKAPFGDPNWFIVMATLPTGQISNHYHIDDFGLFDVPCRNVAEEWDGHTAADVADRLTRFLNGDF